MQIVVALPLAVAGIVGLFWIVLPAGTYLSESRIQPTGAQLAVANDVLDDARDLATFQEESIGLNVRFKYGVLAGRSREDTYRLVTTIAGADAVSLGRRRYVYFYDSTGEEVATASPVTGINMAK